MAVNSERSVPQPDHRSSQSRKPRFTYSRLEVANGLVVPVDVRLGLINKSVGEGYVVHDGAYIARLQELQAEGKEMSAEEYGEFCNDTSEKMLKDKYAKGGHAVPIGVFAYNGDKEGKNLAGNGRVVFSSEKILFRKPKIELTELVVPVVDVRRGKWRRFLKEHEAKDPCELGRVVAVDGYRSEEQTPDIIEHLIDAPNGVIDVAQARGSDTILTVAKHQFIRHTRGSGLDFGERHDITLTPAGLAVAEIFPGYWNDPDDPPGLYIATVPPKQAANA